MFGYINGMYKYWLSVAVDTVNWQSDVNGIECVEVSNEMLFREEFSNLGKLALAGRRINSEDFSNAFGRKFEGSTIFAALFKGNMVAGLGVHMIHDTGESCLSCLLNVDYLSSSATENIAATDRLVCLLEQYADKLGAQRIRIMLPKNRNANRQAIHYIRGNLHRFSKVGIRFDGLFPIMDTVAFEREIMSYNLNI